MSEKEVIKVIVSQKTVVVGFYQKITPQLGKTIKDIID